jgi:hypothetical protein
VFAWRGAAQNIVVHCEWVHDREAGEWFLESDKAKEAAQLALNYLGQVPFDCVHFEEKATAFHDTDDLPPINQVGSGVRIPADGRSPNSGPSLRRVSSGDEGLTELILRDGLGKFLGRAVSKRPVRPTLVILMPPGLDPVVSVLQGLEPVRMQTLPS